MMMYVYIDNHIFKYNEKTRGSVATPRGSTASYEPGR